MNRAASRWPTVLGLSAGALVLVWLAVLGLVAVPIRGRSATGWLVASVAHLVGATLRWSRWRSKAAVGRGDDLTEPDLPGVVAGIGIHDGPPQGPTAAPNEACMKQFVPLREDAEKRGKAIKAASDRKAPPDEACKLISAYSQAEAKMIKYVEANAAKCGIPPQIGDQLKGGHKNTEALQQKVCGVAQQMAQQQKAAAPSLSEALGSIQAPEAQDTKKGGATFDTLNGNVLTR